MKSKAYAYQALKYEKLIQNIITNHFYFCFILFLEFYQIFIDILKTSAYLSNENFDFNEPETILHYLNFISLKYQLKKILGLNETNGIYTNMSSSYYSYYSSSSSANNITDIASNSISTSSSVTLDSVKIAFFVVSLFILLVNFILYILLIYDLSEKKNTFYILRKNVLEEENSNFSIIYFLLANFKDLSYHLFGSFIFDIFFYILIFSLDEWISLKSLSLNILLMCVAGIEIFYFSYNYVRYICNINFIIQFTQKLKSNYDNIFSKKYDLLILTLKICFGIINSLALLNITNKFTLKFMRLFIFIILLSFITFVFYSSLSRHFLFLINENKNNKRIFYCLVCSIFFINGLISNLDYRIEFFSFFSFALNFFIAFAFAKFLLKKNYFKLIKNSEDLVYQVAYVIDKQFNHNQNVVMEDLNNIILNHKLACCKSDCSIKQIEDFSVKTFFDVYMAEISSNKNHRNNSALVYYKDFLQMILNIYDFEENTNFKSENISNGGFNNIDYIRSEKKPKALRLAIDDKSKKEINIGNSTILNNNNTTDLLNVNINNNKSFDATKNKTSKGKRKTISIKKVLPMENNKDVYSDNNNENDNKEKENENNQEDKKNLLKNILIGGLKKKEVSKIKTLKFKSEMEKQETKKLKERNQIKSNSPEKSHNFIADRKVELFTKIENINENLNVMENRQKKKINVKKSKGNIIRILYSSNKFLESEESISRQMFMKDNSYCLIYFMMGILIKDIFLDNHKQFINYEMVKIYVKIFSYFSSVLKTLEEIIVFVYNKCYNKIFELFSEINSKEKNLIDFYKITIKNKNTYLDNYSLYICKFLFQEIFNFKLEIDNDIIFSPDINTQIVNFFKTDNYINLKSKKDSFEIIKSTKHFINYTGMNIEKLFPESFRNEILEKFKSSIVCSDGVFFIFKTIVDYEASESEASMQQTGHIELQNVSFNNANNLLKSQAGDSKSSENILKFIKFECRIYPSLDIKRIIILANYFFYSEDVIIFEKDIKNNVENLHNFSPLISQFLKIPSYYLKLFKNNHLGFHNIFKVDENNASNINNKAKNSFKKGKSKKQTTGSESNKLNPAADRELVDGEEAENSYAANINNFIDKNKENKNEILFDKSEFILDFKFFLPKLKAFYENFLERDFLPDDYQVYNPFKSKEKKDYFSHDNISEGYENDLINKNNNFLTNLQFELEDGSDAEEKVNEIQAFKLGIKKRASIYDIRKYLRKKLNYFNISLFDEIKANLNIYRIFKISFVNKQGQVYAKGLEKDDLNENKKIQKIFDEFRMSGCSMSLNLFESETDYLKLNDMNNKKVSAEKKLMIANDFDSKKIKKYLFVLSIVIGIFLLCGLITLIIGINLSNKIQNLFLLSFNFHRFSYAYYYSEICLLANVDIIDYSDLNMLNAINNVNNNYNSNTNSNNFINYVNYNQHKSLENYYQKKFYNNGIKLDIPKFLFDELKLRIDGFKNDSITVKDLIYQIDDSSISEEFNTKKFDYYYLSSIEKNKFNFVKNNFLIFDSFNVFISLINIILNDSKNIIKNIYLMDFSRASFANNDINNYYVFSGQENSAEKITTPPLLSILNILLNFQNTSNVIEYFRVFIREKFLSLLNYFYYLIFYIFLTLILLHLILVLIAILTMKIFKDIIGENISLIDILLQENKRKFLLNKFADLKSLNGLYCENPLTLIKKIKENKKALKERYDKSKMNNYKTFLYSSTLSMLESNDVNGNNNSGINKEIFEQRRKSRLGGTEYNFTMMDEKVKENILFRKSGFIKKSEIIKQLMMFLKFIFLLYYLYSVLLFLAFYYINDDIITKNNFTENNWNIARYLNSNFLFFKLMTLMNITDYKITDDYYNYFNKNFANETYSGIKNSEFINNNLIIESRINAVYDQLEMLHKMELVYPNNADLLLYNYDYIDCEFIFKNFTDSIYSKLAAQYESSKAANNFRLSDELIKICNLYPFMKLKNNYKILEEINYKTHTLYNEFNDSSKALANIQQIYQKDTLYDLTNIILFILRPIREITRNNLFFPMAQSAINLYLIFTIIYLVFNFMVDLLIFFLINKNIIKRVLLLNDDFRSAIKCFRINT